MPFRCLFPFTLSWLDIVKSEYVRGKGPEKSLSCESSSVRYGIRSVASGSGPVKLFDANSKLDKR